jgi:hypothetical protein
MAEKSDKGVRLSDEQKKRLGELDDNVQRARQELEVMRRLGLDVTAIEEKLDWADETRKVLLQEFGD